MLMVVNNHENEDNAIIRFSLDKKILTYEKCIFKQFLSFICR